MRLGKLLIIDDEKDIRDLIKEIFVEEGYLVETAANGAQARESWRKFMPDVIFLDIWMPDIDGISLLKEMQQEGVLENSKVVMMSGHGTIETAIEATKLGAYDFLEKPLSLAKLTVTAERAIENARLNQENRQLKQSFPEQFLPVGKSKSVIQLRETVERLSKFTMPILIQGEAGVGKHHLAQALHKTSLRDKAPLVEISAIDLNRILTPPYSEGLQRIKAADLGTLVISQTDYLEPQAQDLLFNIINQRESQIGENSFYIDSRVIVICKGDLESLVAQGKFREDLYERLKVMPIEVPALRQHTEDIPELVDFFVNHFVSHEGLEYRHFSVATQNVLRQYSWPGNLKELKNLVQRLLILGEGEVDQEEVTTALQDPKKPVTLSSQIDTSISLKQAKDQLEGAYLSQLLRETGGNVSEAAKRSGVERTNLYRKLKSFGIDPKNPI